MAKLPERLGRLSEAAYIKFEKNDEEYEKLAVRVQELGYSLLSTYDEKGTQAILCKATVALGGMVLAIRGTEKNKTDILTDLRVKFYGGTHRGFRKAWGHIESAVANDIKEYRRTDRRGQTLVVCGHSLGGAISIIAGESLEADLVMTFGCQRVHSSEVRLKIPVIRHQHGWDIVPFVPLALMGYKHVGNRVQIGTRSWIPRPLKDHSIARYIKVLSRL